MTLDEAVAVLNRNKFWGFDTWHVEQQGQETIVVPIPGGYGVFPADAIKLAMKHPHDDGRSPVAEAPKPQDKSAEVMKTWGFNAQTLLSFVANMSDDEKYQLVSLLWPAIEKRQRIKEMTQFDRQDV